VKFKERLVGKLQRKNQLEKLDLDWKLQYAAIITFIHPAWVHKLERMVYENTSVI
jgi:hypothetical protein